MISLRSQNLHGGAVIVGSSEVLEKSSHANVIRLQNIDAKYYIVV